MRLPSTSLTSPLASGIARDVQRGGAEAWCLLSAPGTQPSTRRAPTARPLGTSGRREHRERPTRSCPQACLGRIVSRSLGAVPTLWDGGGRLSRQVSPPRLGP